LSDSDLVGEFRSHADKGAWAAAFASASCLRNPDLRTQMMQSAFGKLSEQDLGTGWLICETAMPGAQMWVDLVSGEGVMTREGRVELVHVDRLMHRRGYTWPLCSVHEPNVLPPGGLSYIWPAYVLPSRRGGITTVEEPVAAGGVDCLVGQDDRFFLFRMRSGAAIVLTLCLLREADVASDPRPVLMCKGRGGEYLGLDMCQVLLR